MVNGATTLMHSDVVGGDTVGMKFLAIDLPRQLKM